MAKTIRSAATFQDPIWPGGVAPVHSVIRLNLYPLVLTHEKRRRMKKNTSTWLLTHRCEMLWTSCQMKRLVTQWPYSLDPKQLQQMKMTWKRPLLIWKLQILFIPLIASSEAKNAERRLPPKSPLTCGPLQHHVLCSAHWHALTCIDMHQKCKLKLDTHTEKPSNIAAATLIAQQSSRSNRIDSKRATLVQARPGYAGLRGGWHPNNHRNDSPEKSVHFQSSVQDAASCHCREVAQAWIAMLKPCTRAMGELLDLYTCMLRIFEWHQ